MCVCYAVWFMMTWNFLKKCIVTTDLMALECVQKRYFVWHFSEILTFFGGFKVTLSANILQFGQN